MYDTARTSILVIQIVASNFTDSAILVQIYSNFSYLDVHQDHVHYSVK